MHRKSGRAPALTSSQFSDGKPGRALALTGNRFYREYHDSFTERELVSNLQANREFYDTLTEIERRGWFACRILFDDCDPPYAVDCDCARWINRQSDLLGLATFLRERHEMPHELVALLCEFACESAGAIERARQRRDSPRRQTKC